MSKKYSPISVRVKVAEHFRGMAQEMGYENTETLQICMAAYDIINNTRHGGAFTRAVQKAVTEARSDD